MDKLSEIKKLKQLLDEGIIDEEDFKRKKSQLLDISNDKKEKTSEEPVERNIEVKSSKSKSLDEYEKELMAKSEKEEQLSKKFPTKTNDDFYQQEKLKALAKLDAEEEIRNKRKEETKAVVDKGVNKAKKITKWVLAVLLWIFGIFSLCDFKELGLVYIPLGIIMILQGCMACPKITEYTQKFEKYTRFKKIIVWLSIIIWVVICASFPVNNNQSDNNNSDEYNNSKAINK